MRHYPMAGGKRLRPVMAMTVAEAVGGPEAAERAIPFGICLEVVHNFTLVHDDIMDDDDTRRGRPSVHKKYGLATAINAGDALFARSFEILLESDLDDGRARRLTSMVATMVREIGEGQQEDMEMEGGLDITVERYMGMIEKKTARMFQTAAAGGALIAGGTEEQIAAMDGYGRSVGVGFQIWDDLLDLTADEEKLGKPVGSDLIEGKRTVIVLDFLKSASDGQKERFRRAFENKDATEEDLAAAVGALREAGSIEYATRMATDFARGARENLGVLPECPARDALAGLVDYMVSRGS
jgi:geranylgeranyl diphosphate synthase type I